MVSQDSPPNQFLVPDCITNQNQYESHSFDAYGSSLRSCNAFPQSLGVLPSIQTLGERMCRSIDLVESPSATQESEASHTRHLMDLLGAANASNMNQQAQGLSLSLGSQMLAPQVQYRQRTINSHLFSPGYLIPAEDERKDCNPDVEQVNNDYSFTDNAFASSSNLLSRFSSNCYGTESFGIAIKDSRYLKPTQILLEEIVSLGSKAIEISNEKYVGKLFPGNRRGSLGFYSELKAELCCNSPLSADRHDLQVKIAKLIALLEEIEGRYEKYYHQMEDVVSSFEEVAGLGAAKSYTALALQAMSRHFCNLRDAIVSQINAARRKISQDLPKISSGMSRLSLIDRESGNNRISLHQLGMINSQRQAWRPIRGLPETSVTILRTWLFEHFLHPYPNDSEKLMLASQTGLTKNQVSNWFINARVRLWKPMIEEMYKEEFADSSEDSNPSLNCGSMTKEGVAADHDHSDD
ncbi:BEL1-like homeodomain protein 11 [Euphorbia lathyris]|uniref:BEL1-like homeodomain protein 11 n=1 Tax=Euphorbia lathyris TaxID=212925 RepID=UPI003313C023